MITPNAVHTISDDDDRMAWCEFPEIEIKNNDTMVLFATLSRGHSSTEYLHIEDAISWQEVVLSKPSDNTTQIKVWTKKATVDNEIPTRVRTSYNMIMRASLVVVSDLDIVTSAQVATSAAQVADVIYPSISAVENSITLYCGMTDNSDMSIFPQMQKLKEDTEYQVGYRYAQVAQTEPSFVSTRESADEFASCAINFSRTTTEKPFYSTPYNPISKLDYTKYHYILDIIRASGKTFDGVAQTWTMTDGVVSGDLIEGRVYYLSNSTIANMPNGYYYATASGTTPNFREANNLDGSATGYFYQSVDIIPATGFADVQDIGIINADESYISSGNIVYSNRNYYGYCVQLADVNLTSNFLKILLRKHNGTRTDKVFIMLVDSAGAWKFIENYKGKLDIEQTICLEGDSAQQAQQTNGVFDVTSVRYIGFFGTSNYSSSRLYPVYFNDISVCEPVIYHNPVFNQVSKYIDNFLFSASLGLGFLIRGNTTIKGYINEKINSLGYPKRDWNYICDNLKTALKFEDITGSFKNQILYSDAQFIFDEVNNNADSTGLVVKSAQVALSGLVQNRTIFECLRIVQNGYTIMNCVIEDSVSVDAVQLTGDVIDCSITGSDYCFYIDEDIDVSLLGNTYDYNVKLAQIANGVTDVLIYTDDLTLTSADFENPHGANIEITYPDVITNFYFPNIIEGSKYQVKNITQDNILVDCENVPAGGIDKDFLRGTDYVSGDLLRVRITYQNLKIAKKEIELFAICANDDTEIINPIEQEDLQSYISADIDGATISEFVFDSPNLEIDINDADNITEIQRIGAWYQYYITTSDGIENLFGALNWQLVNSILIKTENVDLNLDNKKATPLMLQGGRLYKDNGHTIIASSSNSIQIDYDPVYSIRTDVEDLKVYINNSSLRRF